MARYGRRHNITITGGINVPSRLTLDDFLIRFYQWLESQNCFFTGFTTETDDLDEKGRLAQLHCELYQLTDTLNERQALIAKQLIAALRDVHDDPAAPHA
jgi:hypothetical protein